MQVCPWVSALWLVTCCRVPPKHLTFNHYMVQKLRRWPAKLLLVCSVTGYTPVVITTVVCSRHQHVTTYRNRHTCATKIQFSACMQQFSIWFFLTTRERCSLSDLYFQKLLPIKLLLLWQLLVIHTFVENITQHFDLHGSIHPSLRQVNMKPDFSINSNWGTFLYV